MAEIEIQGESMVIHLRGWAAVWALKRKIEVPLANIQGATFDSALARQHPKGVRAPGAYLPRVITAGTYRWRGRREFWSVRHPDKAIVISLANDYYERLVIEVADPLETISMIEAASGSRPEASG